jgi:hypothetical protein
MTAVKYCEEGIRHVDYWSVLKVIKNQEVTYRLLSSTDDDFFDRWRLNSGIVNFTIEHGLVDFHGYSGSVYRCRLEDEVINPIMASMLAKWEAQFESPSYSIRAIGFEQFLIEWATYKPKWI